MKNTFLLSLIFSLSTICLLAQESNLVIDKIVAKVGDEIILYSEIEDQYSYIKSQETDISVDKCEILSDLIAQALLTNQAKLDSVEVTDQQVDEQLEARLDRILQLMNNDVSQFENYYGKTVSEVRSDMRTSIKNQLLSEQMRNQVVSDIEATPSETKAFFNRIPKDSIPYYNAEVELNELVFKPRISEEEKNKAIDKLEEIKQRILDGEFSFEKAATLYSQDQGSARNGGDLGMMKRGNLVWEYESAAYNLDKNEISDVVESEFGYHIIRLVERRGNNIHTQHILMKPKLTDSDLKSSLEKLDSIKTLIVQDSLPFAQAVKTYGDENVQSYNNGGGMVNPQTGNSFFEIGDLEPDEYFAIDTIDAGEVAGPIEYTERDGTLMLKLIQLKTISEPHRASLSTDYAKIKQMADQEKQHDSFIEWINNKMKNTYLAVYPPYENCSTIDKWLEEKGTSQVD